jgi:hypothetical protein
LKKEICAFIDKPEDSVMLAFLSYRQIEKIVDSNDSIQTIMQLDKKQNLFALELTE